MEQEQRMFIARTILEQLGGRRFLAMTGARDLTALPEGGLVMKLPSNLTKDRISHVTITLTAMDDYQVEAVAVRAGKIKPITFREGIYCENLRETFESITGLVTSLGTMGARA